MSSFARCSNGRSRVGVYCAASIAIEQAIEHQEVDVFTAVKVVRRHRPQLVENIVSIITIIYTSLLISYHNSS